MRVRFGLLVGCTICVFLFLAGTLYNIQVRHADRYEARAKAQQLLNSDLIPERGTISLLDKDGRSIPLAVNQDYNIIFAVPKEIDDTTETGSRVATLLGLAPETIIAKLNKASSGALYKELVVKATDSDARAIDAAEIKGIYTTTKRGRHYPFGSVAAQVVGFVSQPDELSPFTGQYGIEKQFDAMLLGTPGAVGEKGVITPPTPGENIQLTIDQYVQQHAQEILENLVKDKRAKSGSIIVEDPVTGKILGLTNYPTFDPNEYGKSPLEVFTNPAVQGLYEPGSVLKPLTMAIGIDTGVITPNTTYYDPGYFTANGKTIKNWDLLAHGMLTMTNVIEQSINTGVVFVEKKIGHSRFYDYLLKFGLKDLTGITLPGEAAGRLTPLEKYPRDINFATASYGQGVAVTPIRMIAAMSAIANGGMMVEPYIIEGAHTPPPRTIVSPQTARQVTDMMVSAVDKAKVAVIPQYTVAGKTGTAFVPDFVSGGYSDKVINTYIGFAPAYKPRFIILIKLDQPENAPLAGTTVVPAFREFAEFLLNYYTVAPDKVQ